jgi:hypothetical protein
MKIIRINACGDCPYCNNLKGYCNMEEREIDEDIPEWCPLDDR